MLFFFQAEDGIRDLTVTGVQTCALPISPRSRWRAWSLRRARPGRRRGRRRRADAVGWRPAGGEGRRSEERRVGEEGRSRGAPYHLKKKNKGPCDHIVRRIASDCAIGSIG